MFACPIVDNFSCKCLPFFKRDRFQVFRFKFVQHTYIKLLTSFWFFARGSTASAGTCTTRWLQLLWLLRLLLLLRLPLLLLLLRVLLLLLLLLLLLTIEPRDSRVRLLPGSRFTTAK